MSTPDLLGGPVLLSVRTGAHAPGGFSGPTLSFLSIWLMREEELEAFRTGLGVCVTFCEITSLKDVL